MALRSVLLALAMMAAAGPAMAQGLLPAEPPKGLDLRVWLGGAEPAEVRLALTLGDGPPCRIGGRFDPAVHVNTFGGIAAGTPCGLRPGERAALAGRDGLVTVRLVGKVETEGGWSLAVNRTERLPLHDVFDAHITFGRDIGIVFVPAAG